MGYHDTMKLKLLHFVSRALGILVHIDGLPYGRRGKPQERTDRG